jgi:protein involved in polysaccharide export with SLBB domain
MTMLLRIDRMMKILLATLLLANALHATAQTQLPPQAGGTLTPSATPMAPAPVTPDVAVPVAQTVSLPSPLGAPVVFGSQMFTGRFGALTFTGFNPDYQIAVGDRLLLRMWGAVTYEAPQTVDPQGNIFVPNVGPIQVLGIRNQDLNRQVEEQVRRTFRSNVGVYATLDSAQPVKIYVTGFVRSPGLYAGLSSDSVLNYLDKAGGIDAERGSYLSVQILRGGKLRATMNLYRFLLAGVLDRLQFQDGDTVVVQPRRYSVTVAGEAQNAYVFELDRPEVPISEVLGLAVPKPSATHLSIIRNTGVQLASEYYPLAKTEKVTVRSGDLVTFTADKYTTTLLVRISGAQLGERALVLPTGATLKDLLDRLNPSPQADLSSLQLFRRSVQQRQRQSLEVALHNLETAALTARSSTTEEATLRKTESDMMLSFISRARAVQPLGQVVLTNRKEADKMLLEDGDTVNIPERSNLILLSGEVLFPNAQIYSPGFSVDEYVELAGGYTQSADTSKKIVMRPDGSVSPSGSKPQAGDEILVLPKIDSKNLEVTRAISQVLYQIAVAAKVALGL